MRNDKQVLELKALPNPISATELEGLELVTRPSGMAYYKLSTEEPVGPNQGLVGCEYEVAFVPSIIHARKIKDFFLANIQSENPAQTRYRTLRDIQEQVKQILFEKFSEILVSQPHNDGGGLECVFYPATMAAHQMLKPFYKSVLLTLKAYGFDDSYQGAGVHVNIDNSLFGGTSEEQLSAQERMLYFIVQNNDWSVEFSGRHNANHSWVDVYSMLGDPLKNWSEKDFLRAFKNEKGQIFNSLRNGESGFFAWNRFLNIGFGRDGRPCVEYRHFGTTFEVDQFMAHTEYGHAIAQFAKQQQDESQMTLQLFCQFVQEKSEQYQHLYERLNSFAQSATHLLVGAQQQHSRRILNIA